MLLVTGIIGTAALVIVVFVSAQASSGQLAAVQQYIEEGIRNKGQLITANHALALRSMTLDNAFLDIQRLVARAVEEESDLLYGLYVNTQGQPLAYSQRGAKSLIAREPGTERGLDDAPDARSGLNDESSAFRQLGLKDAELVAAQPVVRKARRLGKEVLEVTMPVRDEGGELLGTLHYGLSTERMQDALAQAEADSRQRLIRSLALVASLVGLAVLLGVVLSRVQGSRITRPLSELTHAARMLSAGDRSVQVKIESRDELELLGASFNRMVADLDLYYRKLEDMNRGLEQKVAERTAELGRKNRDMRLVLDNVDQGFATLTPDGTMAAERSRVLSQWFGQSEAPIPFWKYIAPTSPQFAEIFEFGWEQLKAKVLPLELSLLQLPNELTKGEKTFAFRYLPFHRDQQLEGVLLVIDDVTEQLAKADEEARQRELMAVFKRLMVDRRGFETFLRDTDQSLSVLGQHGAGDPAACKRSLHTLKGNAAWLGLAVVAGLCHRLEDEIAAGETMSKATLEALLSRWATIRDHVKDLIGTGGEKVIEVPSAEYGAVVAALSRQSLPIDLLQRIRSWQLEPGARPLRRLAEQAQTLARRLDREIDVVIEANDVRLDPERFAAFFSEAVHVIRNAIDHGLESPAERTRASKPARGKLLLRARSTADTLLFEIADDGRGIDWEAIRILARQQNLPHDTEADLVRALCREGFTTRNVATTVSGRGVGMAAVAERVATLNGSLAVHSRLGKGTSWVFRFPHPAAEEGSHPFESNPSLPESAARAEGVGS